MLLSLFNVPAAAAVAGVLCSPELKWKEKQEKKTCVFINDNLKLCAKSRSHLYIKKSGEKEAAAAKLVEAHCFIITVPWARAENAEDVEEKLWLF